MKRQLGITHTFVLQTTTIGNLYENYQSFASEGQDLEFFYSEPFRTRSNGIVCNITSRKGHDQIVVELLLWREADVNHQTKVRPLLLVHVPLTFV